MYAAYYSKKTTQQNNEITGLIQKAEKGNATARNELRKMAERDNVNAQVALGDYYYNSQNYNEAVRWYRKATTKGNTEATYRLGLCYEKGHGVQKDNKTALLWYNTAAKQGNEIADLMQEAEKGNATARNELRKMAERDNVNAQVALGDYYYNSQNYNEAVRWYRKATTKGNTEATYRLGLCYEKGHGVQKDNKTALLWYNTAAKQGNQEAQKRLNEINKQSQQNTNVSASYAAMYNNEKPTQQNNEITDLIHKAQAGNVDAQYDLGNRYLNGDGVEQDVEKASYWFQQNTANTKKTQNNNASASYAAMYNNEKTTQQNNEIADLIQKAQAGDVEALCKLGTHYYNGNKVEQNYNEAISSLIKCLQIIEEKHNATIKHRVEDIFKILNTINYLNNQSIKDKENDLSISFRNTLISLCNNFIPEYNKYISKDYLDKLECINYDFQIDYKLLLLDEFFYLCDLFKTSDLPKYLAVRLFDCHKKTDNSQKINALNNFESFKDSEEEYNKLKKFNVAICATMSSGKSTFVNALLGNDYLPAKNEATTATITSVYDKDYSNNLLGCIKKGNELIPCNKDVTLKDIENWNTDKNVSQIYLQGDLDNIGNKGAVVCVHDTPGTNNSSNSTHHDITMNFLNENKMDLIIYVSNAEHLGVEDEKQLLTEIKKLETPVLFIINKADSIDFEKEDFEQIKNQHCKYLQDIGFKNPNVLPVSAKAARLFKMSLKDKAERFTTNEKISFISYYTEFTEQIDLSDNSNSKNPYTNETVCITGENYNKQDIFNALNKTGITKIEQTIENYIK